MQRCLSASGVLLGSKGCAVQVFECPPGMQFKSVLLQSLQLHIDFCGGAICASVAVPLVQLLLQCRLG